VLAVQVALSKQNKDTDRFDWISENDVEIISQGITRQVTLWDEKWEKIIILSEETDLRTAVDKAMKGE
jgi:hypothetical protein